MIRITINQAAFDAIASTLPLGSAAYEQEADADGEREIWLAADVVNRMRYLRGPGQSYSDVILRLAAETRNRSTPARKSSGRPSPMPRPP